MSGADGGRMQLIEWRPLIKNSLRGFASVALPCGLKIRDIPVLLGRNGPWASLPNKSLLDNNGQQKRDANGKPAYVAILKWRDRELSDRFSAAVVELIRSQHPDALGEGAGQ